MLQPLLLPHFKKQLKKLLKKYPRLRDSLVLTLQEFHKEHAIHLGKNVYKLRVQSKKDLSKRKSGSFRLIVLLLEVEEFLVPVTIYFKGDTVDISKEEITGHLEMILWELRHVDV
ncbi:MAG: hypothetical protein HYV41_01380 [Candidatus Magasanikbacteria bacterium]|nr:hypothetical protein [Candidatus Magasanikbacteria bacterium]